MGWNHRAVERERLVRSSLSATHYVRIRWRASGDVLLLNVVDPNSGAPLTRERIIRDPQAIADMVDRTIDPPRNSPKSITFRQALASGRGELDVEISDAQYRSLRESC